MDTLQSEFQTTPLPESNHTSSSTARSPSTAPPYPSPGNQASSPEDNLSSDELHVCDICNKTYSKLHHFTKHYRNHAPPLRCPHDACDKKCPQKKDLDRHIRSNHPAWAKKNPQLANLSQEVAEYTCKRCGTYTTDRKDNLKRHADKGTCTKKRK